MGETNSIDKKLRIRSLDLARGLAVFFMILVHVLENYGNDEVYDTVIGRVVEFLGGAPAAPVFMLLMGFFLVYPSDKGLKVNVLRGLKIMALGYVLSFLRYTLPEALGVTHYGGGFDFFSFIWEVDILQFAGFAMIILAVIRQFIPWPRTWVLLAILVTVSAPLLWGVESGITAVDWLLDLLWGNYEEVWFPVFPWISFPLLGMAFSHYVENREGWLTADRRVPAAAAAVLIVGVMITYMDPEYHIGDYYRSGPGAIVWMSGFAVLWLFLCELAVRRIPENRVFRILYYWSKNVTAVYFVQWLIIGWGVAVFPYMEESITVTVILMAVAVTLTHWATRGWIGTYGWFSKKNR
jgi:uncharacterized membrane protein